MSMAVAFSLAERLFAVPLEAVERVVRAVAVTPVPQAPAGVRGVIDLRGTVVPVVDARSRLGLPGRELAPGDQFLILNAPPRRIALWVDRVDGVVDSPPAADGAALPEAGHLAGIVQGRDGLILMHDVAAFLGPPGVPAVDGL